MSQSFDLFGHQLELVVLAIAAWAIEWFNDGPLFDSDFASGLFQTIIIYVICNHVSVRL